MKSFKNYCETYIQHLDGPPLEPHTISGAESQIRQLAANIRTTFNLDPRFKQYSKEIHEASKLLDAAANLLGREINNVEDRFAPHKYHI